MVKRGVLGLALALACVSLVLAADNSTMKRPPMATGTLASLAVAGDVAKWEIDLGADAGGKKTYEMTADVQVAYKEKDGAKQALTIRSAKGREFKAKEGIVVAKGKLASAKVGADNVVVTITPSEGDKPLEVTLPLKVTVMYKEEDGKLTAMGIGVPRPPKTETK